MNLILGDRMNVRGEINIFHAHNTNVTNIEGQREDVSMRSET